MTGSINLGDTAIFDQIYRSYYPALRFFATRYVGNEESEDIVENLFLRLWKQKKVFDDTVHVQSFLYLSVKNACLDYIKVQARKERKNELLLQQIQSLENDYLHSMIRSEVIAEIYRAINNLPSQCGKVVYMDFVEGLNNEEIARELALSVQTVKNHKVRALKMLKQQFPGNAIAISIVTQLLN